MNSPTFRQFPTKASVCAAALMASTFATPALLADTTNMARVMVSPNAAGDYPTDNSVQHAGLCETSAAGTGGFNSSGNGAAATNYGSITLDGVASGSLKTYLFGISHDALTITAPGVETGTAGTLRFTIEVSGELAAPAGGSRANWRLTASLGETSGAYDIDHTTEFYGPQTPAPGYWGEPSGTYTATVDIQFGVSMPLYLSLTGEARAAYSDVNTPGAASVGSPLTGRWMGISAVTAAGEPVAEFTVTSESGTSYSGIATPPEPPSCPADIGCAGGEPGPDGMLDDNDFIVFITAFFDENPVADVGTDGGMPGSDGEFDNNDFIVFIESFFGGC